MLGAYATRTAYEEGYQAGRNGDAIDDNPYNFVWQTAQAYAWEDGFKASKEAA